MVSAGQLKQAIATANQSVDEAVQSLALARDRAERAMQALASAAEGSNHPQLGQANQMMAKVAHDLGDSQVQLQSAMQNANQYASGL